MNEFKRIQNYVNAWNHCPLLYRYEIQSRLFMPSSIYNINSFCLQLTLLRSKVKNKYLLVSNTHLYSQLDAAHIRLLQVGLAMEYIKEIREVMLSELNCLPTDFSIIFCGDLNSVPERGVRQFMLSQSIPGDHEDFKSSKYYFYPQKSIKFKMI